MKITSKGGWCAPSGDVPEGLTIDWTMQPIPTVPRGGLIYTPVPQDGRGQNYIGPDGRVYWRGIERNTMGHICEGCLDGNHVACTRYKDTIEEHCVCGAEAHQRSEQAAEDYRESPTEKKIRLRQAAIDASHVEYDHTGANIPVPAEVLEALISRATKYDQRWGDLIIDVTTSTGETAEVPVIITGTADKIAGIRVENGDPMYVKAKAALEEIGTFRKVDVEHETDIITTSGDGGRDIARYRSGVTEVTITIHGYTR